MHRTGDWYDVMQVCLNGHQITEYAESQPESRENFCSNCGEKTITACPKCNTNIRGYRHIEGVFHSADSPAPKYCINCGQAFPWQTRAVEHLNDVLKDSALGAGDLEELNRALPDVLRDTVKTQSAAQKVKGILGKLGKQTYDIAIKVVTDVATEAAKKQMGL
jgi:hypothetical protein